MKRIIAVTIIIVGLASYCLGYVVGENQGYDKGRLDGQRVGTRVTFGEQGGEILFAPGNFTFDNVTFENNPESHIFRIK